jgi:CotS family spore coat protein
MDYKYWDKAHLSSYSLDTKIFDKYDFSVVDASPIRSVFMLSTSDGYKIFKKIDYSLEELMFIYEALNEVRKQYPYIIQFRKNLEGMPYINHDGAIYVVMDLIEGRECIFENPVDLKNVSIALAKYHAAARNVNFTNCNRNNNYKMIARFKSMIKSFESYLKIAQMHVNKSEFDKIFIDNFDYYISYAKAALKQLVNSPYKNLCSYKKTLCHHDLAHHNIIIGEDENVYFVDFDYALVDLPYHDLSNLIRKAAKSNNWSKESYEIIMNAYAGINGITKEEEQVLYAYMLFPYDLYAIANCYYTKVKDWEEDEFLEKLKRKISYKEEREELLEYIRNKIMDK